MTVKETGSLVLDPNVLHPFVRIHIIDMNTGKYLAKSDRTMPGVTNKESVQMIARGEDAAKDGIIFEQSPDDFFLPLATPFFDMRIKGQNQCQWNEEFVINEKAP